MRVASVSGLPRVVWESAIVIAGDPLHLVTFFPIPSVLILNHPTPVSGHLLYSFQHKAPAATGHHHAQEADQGANHLPFFAIIKVVAKFNTTSTWHPYLNVELRPQKFKGGLRRGLAFWELTTLASWGAGVEDLCDVGPARRKALRLSSACVLQRAACGLVHKGLQGHGERTLFQASDSK